MPDGDVASFHATGQDCGRLDCKYRFESHAHADGLIVARPAETLRNTFQAVREKLRAKEAALAEVSEELRLLIEQCTSIAQSAARVVSAWGGRRLIVEGAPPHELTAEIYALALTLDPTAGQHHSESVVVQTSAPG